MTDIVKGVQEALAVAKGEQPAARVHMNGHTYVPLEEYERLRAAFLASERLNDINAGEIAKLRAGIIAAMEDLTNNRRLHAHRKLRAALTKEKQW
jgi:hypothetical protein